MYLCPQLLFSLGRNNTFSTSQQQTTSLQKLHSSRTGLSMPCPQILSQRNIGKGSGYAKLYLGRLLIQSDKRMQHEHNQFSAPALTSCRSASSCGNESYPSISLMERYQIHTWSSRCFIKSQAI